jgi:hypothetical protein
VGSLESELVLQQDDRAKLTRIVFDVEAVWFALDDSVASTYTNVVDSDLRFVTSAQFELVLVSRDCKQVNVS